jgi:predicted transcriptional regulator YheO
MSSPAARSEARLFAGRAKRGRPRQSLPPEVVREREIIFGALSSVVDLLGAMVGDHIEVVLHDLTRPESSILQIANGHVTGRQVGGPVLAGPRNDKGLAILGDAMLMAELPGHVPVFPYPTQSRDGRSLTSATVLFRDALGQAFASLCLNADFADIEAARSILARLLPRERAQVEQTQVEAPEMEGLMHEIIEASVRRYRKPVHRMSKDEKTAAVEMMLERGLFIVKGGVEKAAAALGVTRFSVYNYLDAIKARRKASAMASAGTG